MEDTGETARDSLKERRLGVSIAAQSALRRKVKQAVINTRSSCPFILGKWNCFLRTGQWHFSGDKMCVKGIGPFAFVIKTNFMTKHGLT